MSKLEALRATAGKRVALVGEGLEMPAETGAGEYATLPIDEIRPDASNPRWGGGAPLTVEEVRNYEAIEDPEKKASVEDIITLAATIESTGLHHPLEVWRDGGVYRILDGERRYLALVYLGRSRVDAKILPEPPQRTRLSQLVANVQRSNLGMPQLLHNLEAILEEAAAQNVSIEDAKSFERYVNFSRSASHRWWTILKGPEDVLEAIRSGAVTRQTEAYSAAMEGNPAQRQRMLYGSASGAERAASEKKNERRGPTRNTTERVRLGSTAIPAVVRTIMEAVEPESVVGVDWSNHLAVKRSFRSFLRSLEKRILDQDKAAS